MITDANRKVSIIAYYISKFDMDAVKALGYGTYTDAFQAMSERFGKTNHYMRLRRDEFDPVIGKTNRHGFNMRNPRAGVLVLHNDLKNYTFITTRKAQPLERNKAAYLALLFYRYGNRL